MGTQNDNGLKTTYRVASVIGIAMILSVLMYALVVELIGRVQAPFEGYAPLPARENVRFAFAVAAIIAATFMEMLRRSVGRGAAPSDGTRSATEVSRRLLTTAVVSYALCEAVAIFGLVLFFLGGSAKDFYSFLAFSLLLFFVYFPRYGKWQEYLGKRHRRNL